jgi:hypothetical protein
MGRSVRNVLRFEPEATSLLSRTPLLLPIPLLLFLFLLLTLTAPVQPFPFGVLGRIRFSSPIFFSTSPAPFQRRRFPAVLPVKGLR